MLNARIMFLKCILCVHRWINQVIKWMIQPCANHVQCIRIMFSSHREYVIVPRDKRHICVHFIVISSSLHLCAVWPLELTLKFKMQFFFHLLLRMGYEILSCVNLKLTCCCHFLIVKMLLFWEVNYNINVCSKHTLNPIWCDNYTN